MPTNLPPEYYRAEKEYKEAEGFPEKIAALEKMLSIMPHHKGTDKLRASLNRKISKLRGQEQKESKTKRTSVFNVDKQGAAQATMVGFANSGKSSLLKTLTNAEPEIASYPFTTQVPVIGMMPYENVQFQLVDIPPVSDEINKLPFYNLLRNTDLQLIVVDYGGDPLAEMQLLLEKLKEGKIVSPLFGEDLPVGVVKKKMILVLSKFDVDSDKRALQEIKKLIEDKIKVIAVSTKNNEGLDVLKKAIFEVADIIRVYTKVPHGEPDLKSPFVLPAGGTVMDLARDIHKDFAENLRFSRVWGSSRFDGQPVQRDFVLKDGDIVELHI